jgi:cell wall assembly regulator SMI1
MVAKLIERLDRGLATKQADYYRQLQTGVTDEDLNNFEKRFGLNLPQSFRSLYKWRNGQRSDCYKSIEDNRMFSSLEEIVETKEMLDGMIGFDFEDLSWWRRGWVPFLSNGGGDHLCLDLTAEDGGHPGQVIAFWHDWEDRSVEYTGFDQWLEQLVEKVEKGSSPGEPFDDES